MRKFILVLFACALLFGLPALAAGSVRISGGSANLRNGPGLGYDTVGTVSDGDTLPYAGATSRDDRGVDWYSVEYGGAVRWVSSKYAVLSADPGPVDPDPVEPENPGGSVRFAVTLPASLEVIDEEAFADDDAMRSLTVPEGALRICSRAFAGCPLEDVCLPASLTYIADDAFDMRDTRMWVTEGTYAWDWALSHGFEAIPLRSNGAYEYAIRGGACTITKCRSDSADAGRLPSSIAGAPVTAVAAGAFEGNPYITALVVPEGVRSLGARAFRGCTALKTITLPGSVTDVGEGCFADCPALARAEQAIWYDPLEGPAGTSALGTFGAETFAGYDDRVVTVGGDGSVAVAGYGRTTVEAGPVLWRITVAAPPTILDDYPARHPLYSVAHRGGKAYWPENTLEAFSHSGSAGADFIELDAQTTLDGVQVVHHNLSFKAGNTTYTIAERTYAELVRAKPSLCTLDEAVELIAGTGVSLQLELKVTADPAKCLEIVKRHGMMDRTWFISFKVPLLRQVRRLDSAAKLGLVFDDKECPDDIDGLVYELRLGAVAPKHTVFTKELLDHWHRMGLLVDVWQGSTPELCRTWSEMGVDLITSDWPDYPVSARQGRAPVK